MHFFRSKPRIEIPKGTMMPPPIGLNCWSCGVVTAVSVEEEKFTVKSVTLTPGPLFAVITEDDRKIV